MATTTNYSWSTPDDTALVKDGAAAIRSLGTAIDTTVFNNAGAAIAKTIVDAKGDIIVATAADTVSRLAVGANDTVLVADSAQATGVKWATPSSGGMTLLSTTTLSGATTTISSISQSYTDLYIAVYGVTFAADAYFMIYFQNGATYQNQSSVVTYNTTTNNIANDAVLRPTYVNNQKAANSTNNLGLQLKNYTEAVAGYRNFIWSGFHREASSDTNRGFDGGGGLIGASAINALTFEGNGGNFSSGTVKIWGIK
jgi:hypothetical protein